MMVVVVVVVMMMMIVSDLTFEYFYILFFDNPLVVFEKGVILSCVC